MPFSHRRQLEENCVILSSVLYPDATFVSSIIILKSRPIYLTTSRKKIIVIKLCLWRQLHFCTTGALGLKETVTILPSCGALWWSLARKCLSSSQHRTVWKSESEFRRNKGAFTAILICSVFSAGIRSDKNQLQCLGIYFDLKFLSVILSRSVEGICAAWTKC